MAININILTKFDSKGLRTAKKELGNATRDLKNSTASLGKNFAVLGAGLVGAGALIAKNAKALARIESINAQTEATISSMGNTAGISASQIEKLAGSLENVTATEAETIQEGANLLLTFKNIRNEAGAGNDIFTQTTTAMVDLARAMGTDASGEAIKLGKALNDPTKGITALTRVGVSFTEEQKNQIKSLQQSGDLMGAQKIILSELQAQFGGSGAAYAKTFSGQLELMGHELGTIGEEATLAVMPALQNMVTQLRELIPVVGPQLKAAIESVDWEALVKSVVDFTTFLITNAEAISKTLAALWLLSTAIKIVTVAFNLGKVAAALYNSYLATIAGQASLTRTALLLLRPAMLLAGVAVAVYAVADSYIKTKKAIQDTRPQIQGLNAEVATFATMKIVPSGIAGTFQMLLKGFINAAGGADTYKAAVKGINNIDFSTHVDNISTLKNAWFEAWKAKNKYDTGGADDGKKDKGGSYSPPAVAKTVSGLKTLTKTLKQEATKQKQFVKLTTKLGFTEGLASQILGGKSPIKTAKSIIQGTAKAANKLKNLYLKSSAGIAEAASIQDAANAKSAEVARLAKEAADELAQSNKDAADALAEAAAEEAAILAEKERVYDSFLDSVKQTFSQIKDSIMGAFTLKDLGSSTNSIIRNMDKMLVKVRAFAVNVGKLSSMGLDPALLQQVISAGPVAGASLAASLVAGGTGALSTINAGYAEMGLLSSQIATTGTEAAFGNTAQQTIYNLNIDGGVGSGATIGKAIVDAIKAYERTSGAVWQGA